MKIIISLLILFSINTSARNIGTETGLEVPRFVSLKSNDANIRVGPSVNYPIILKYVITDFPLKIIDEHKDWRQINDFENNKGWIHKSLIKGERHGITISTNDNMINIFNTVSGRIVGKIKIHNIIKLEKCKLNWCLISKDSHKGWIEKKYIWGVNKNEIIKIGYMQFFVDLYFRSVNGLSKYLNIN